MCPYAIGKDAIDMVHCAQAIICITKTLNLI